MQFTTVFFDLDETLYPASTGLWPALKERMNAYMRERVGISAEDVPILREKYFREYGTTMHGLQIHHGLNAADYLAYVHDLPLEKFLAPDPVQREVIASVTARRLIFTNADAAHARRVLSALELGDLFDVIVDVNAVAPFCKPMPEALQTAMRLAGESDPARCVLIDDLPRTTRAAGDFGMFSILYGQAESTPEADATFTDWSRLPALLDGRAPAAEQ